MKQKSHSSLLRKWEKAEPINSILNLKLGTLKTEKKNKFLALTSRVGFERSVKLFDHSGYSKTLQVKRKNLQERKYQVLMEKISSVPELRKNSENVFRKRVKKNMKSLEDFDLVAKKEVLEEKQVVNEFSKTVKGKMFSISKTGQQFRKANLTRHLKEEHKLKCK